MKLSPEQERLLRYVDKSRAVFALHINRLHYLFSSSTVRSMINRGYIASRNDDNTAYLTDKGYDYLEGGAR